MTTDPQHADPTPAEERVARHLAGKDWLHQEDPAWARLARIPDDYLDVAREVIALVHDAAPVVVPPAADLAAAEDPTPLRWGLNDTLWGDDDTVTVLLSGPAGEPYWLELDPERAGVLRGDLAGPDGEQPVDRAALRDRIAAAIWERQNPGRRWADCEYRWKADAEADADAVLAVLPEPADWAATRLHQTERDMLTYALDLAQEQMHSRSGEFTTEDQEAVDALRRMADEAPQPDTETSGEIDRLRAELAKAIDQRNYWHSELMNADARIAELGRRTAAESAEGAQPPSAVALTRVTDHTHTGPVPACDTARFGETCGRPAGEHQMRDDL